MRSTSTPAPGSSHLRHVQRNRCLSLERRFGILQKMANRAESTRLCLSRSGVGLVRPGADRCQVRYLHQAGAEVRQMEARLGRGVVAAAAPVENDITLSLAQPKLVFKLKFSYEAPPVVERQSVAGGAKGAKRLGGSGVLLPQRHQRLPRLRSSGVGLAQTVRLQSTCQSKPGTLVLHHNNSVSFRATYLERAASAALNRFQLLNVLLVFDLCCDF